jgi:HSP20 family protein
MATQLAPKKKEIRPFSDRFFDTAGPFSELTSVYFRNGTYTVDVVLPGLEKKDVNIEIEGKCLTVSSELRRGGFSRSVIFPEDIDSETVEATFDHGVLKIEIPSLRPAQPQKVAIK